MIRVILFLTTLATAAICDAQVKETRTVADFTEIHVSSGIQVIYTQSDTKSIVAESDNQEKVNRIGTEVKNGILRIFIKPKKGESTFKILKVYVSAPDVKSFKVDSGANIEIENLLQSKSNIEFDLSSGSKIAANVSANSVELDLDSGSNFTGKLNANNIEIDMDSGSKITVSGEANYLDLEIDSGSNFSGKDLTVKSAHIEADSASIVTVTVTESIEASAASLAKINYYGNPKNANKKSSSLGEVNEK